MKKCGGMLLSSSSFAEHDNVVEELASKRAVDALDEAVLPRRLWCRLDWFNAENLYAIVEPRTEYFVPVMKQESWFGSVTRKRLEHLAQCPGGRRVRRDVEVDDTSGVYRGHRRRDFSVRPQIRLSSKGIQRKGGSDTQE